MVCRWAGGNNAGHTVFVNGKKYKTHLIPSGVFHNITSVIGPGCVLHKKSFYEEINYLEEHGFDTSYVKVSPKCHIVLDEYIDYDKKNLAKKLGTTSKGIAPAYAAKAARKGVLAKDVLDEKFLWDEKLEGKILCEGAQGVWLDLDHGNYPYVTSSCTLPYGACSLGFPSQKIRNIWGAAKVYDTRSGEDPDFPETLFDNKELLDICDLGKEYGVTTGRRRKVNYLDLNRLIKSINITGTTHAVISKCDILNELGVFKLFWDKEEPTVFATLDMFKDFIDEKIKENSPLVEEVIFSSSPEKI